MRIIKIGSFRGYWTTSDLLHIGYMTRTKKSFVTMIGRDNRTNCHKRKATTHRITLMRAFRQSFLIAALIGLSDSGRIEQMRRAIANFFVA